MPVRNGSRTSALLGKSAPPLARIRLAAHAELDVATGRPVDLERHRAEVDVEVGAVGAERGQPQIVLAQLLNVVVDLGHPIDDLGGHWSAVLDVALQSPPSAFQKVG